MEYSKNAKEFYQNIFKNTYNLLKINEKNFTYST